MRTSPRNTSLSNVSQNFVVAAHPTLLRGASGADLPPGHMHNHSSSGGNGGGGAAVAFPEDTTEAAVEAAVAMRKEAGTDWQVEVAWARARARGAVTREIAVGTSRGPALFGAPKGGGRGRPKSGGESTSQSSEQNGHRCNRHASQRRRHRYSSKLTRALARPTPTEV